MTPLMLVRNVGVFLFGHSDKMFLVLVALVVTDYITGICVAIHQKKLSSTIGVKGITRKVAIFALVALSHILDEYILESSHTLMTVTTAFYSTNECMSIFENVGRLGIPLPQKLKDILTYFEKLTKKK